MGLALWRPLKISGRLRTIQVRQFEWILGQKPTFLETNLDGNNGGLFFKGKSKGLVENNTIARNRLANIAVFGGAHPVIRSNKIYDGQAEAN